MAATQICRNSETLVKLQQVTDEQGLAVLQLQHQVLSIKENFKLEVQRSLQDHLPEFRRDLDVELQKQICQIRGDLELQVQDLYKREREQRLELQKQVVEFRRDIIQTDTKMETEIRFKIGSIGNDLAALTKAHGVALSDTLAKANQELQLKQQATDSAVKLLQNELESTKAAVQILQALSLDNRKLEEDVLELKRRVAATSNPSTHKKKHAPVLEEEAMGISARYVEKWETVTHGEGSVGLPFNAKDALIAKDGLITSSDSLSSIYSKSSGTQQTQLVSLTSPPPEFLHSEQAQLEKESVIDMFKRHHLGGNAFDPQAEKDTVIAMLKKYDNPAFSIRRDEFEIIMQGIQYSEEDHASLFDAIDTNHDGRISCPEFVEWVSKQYPEKVSLIGGVSLAQAILACLGPSRVW